MIRQKPDSLIFSLSSGLVARELGPDDAEALRALRQHVLETLENPDYYRVEGETGDWITDHFAGRGVVIGIFAEKALVAYGALGLPGPGEPNRGADLPLPPTEWPWVAHLTSVMVAPSHRGYALHPWLLAQRLKIGTERGRRHFLTTVSPRNHPSWGNLVAHGVYIKRLIQVGDLVRCLVHRDTAETVRFEGAETCPCWDFDRQRALLADGQWVWGKDEGSDGQALMRFGRPIPLETGER